jgi:hypothetical protein
VEVVLCSTQGEKVYALGQNRHKHRLQPDTFVV